MLTNTSTDPPLPLGSHDEVRGINRRDGLGSPSHGQAFLAIPASVFVGHELDKSARNFRPRGHSCLFVLFVVAQRGRSRTSPDEGRMSSRPRCPPTVLLLRASCFVIPSSLGISSFVFSAGYQGRPPAASNPSPCVATAARYQSCSAALELRVCSFVISFVISTRRGCQKYLRKRRHHEPQPPAVPTRFCRSFVYSGKLG